MKPLARAILRRLAAQVLRRYQPLVIGVAGSVGKTGAKDAVAAALHRPDRPIRWTQGNFNAEVGLPVTILTGKPAPARLSQWLGTVVAGVLLLLQRQFYPPILVVELGADRPGDLKELIELAQPRVGILTSTAPEHLEFFGSQEGVVEEESLIVRMLPDDSQAIVNIDDERNAAVAQALHGPVMSYGWAEGADVRAHQLNITRNHRGLPDGMVVKVAVAGSVLPIALPGVIGRHQVYPVLAAVAVSHYLGEDLIAVGQRLSAYRPPPGRMHVFEGLEGSVIIDDSYNASPEAVIAALDTLRDLDVPGKKYAILGQMSELGSSAAHWHDEIGARLSPDWLQTVITVGPLAERIGTAAIKKGFPTDRVVNVPTAEAAAALMQPRIGGGDAVLLKGSRFASRLERAVRILLANPIADEQYLVNGH